MSNFYKLLTVPGKPLPSRRNILSVIFAYGELAVRKEYPDAEKATQELVNLSAMMRAGLRAPKPVLDSDNIIIFTYEEGITYDKLLSSWEAGKVSAEMAASAFKALCRWLFDFYNTTGKLKGDVKLHNFIYGPGGKCTGLDFEEPFRDGQPELELGALVAYAATETPALTPAKKQICLFLLSQCLHNGYRVSEVKRGYIERILEMGRMRPNYKRNAEKAIEFFNEITEKKR